MTPLRALEPTEDDAPGARLVNATVRLYDAVDGVQRAELELAEVLHALYLETDRFRLLLEGEREIVRRLVDDRARYAEVVAPYRAAAQAHEPEGR